MGSTLSGSSAAAYTGVHCGSFFLFSPMPIDPCGPQFTLGLSGCNGGLSISSPLSYMCGEGAQEGVHAASVVPVILFKYTAWDAVKTINY